MHHFNMRCIEWKNTGATFYQVGELEPPENKTRIKPVDETKTYGVVNRE